MASVGAGASDRAQVAQAKESRLRQVIQHFFTKAALTIISSRVELPQCFYKDTNEIRSNRWFNLILDESDTLMEDLLDWSSMDITEEKKSKPLTIEIYLDLAELTRNQTLIVVDERNKRWDVVDALSSAVHNRSRREKNTKVVLERWRISLEDLVRGDTNAESMPNVYKKAVVLFRSLYSYCRFLPAWNFGRRLAKQSANLAALRPMYRIVHDDLPDSNERDLLAESLYPSADATFETHRFQRTSSPAGNLSIQVTYRTNCNFLVDDTEAALSSRFMGMDDHVFEPSIGGSPGAIYHAHGKEPGSLPADRRWTGARPDLTQAYGSMSTFHNLGGPPTGTSPISALRAAEQFASESPPDSATRKQIPEHRVSQSSKSSLRSTDSGAPPAVQRRVSVSFQPFKAGSLSSSPGRGAMNAPPSPSTSRPSSMSGGTAISVPSRNRTSISALPQTALRVPQNPRPDETAVGSPGSASPKAPQMNRYSSSFSNRKSRLSSASGGTVSKTEDDNTSSGKGSQTSSNPPGSGLLVEGNDAQKTSTTPPALTDDDNISDFLKMLESKKGSNIFHGRDEAARDASARRTTEQLSRFQRLRESHSALTDSMSSSMMLATNRSSQSSSRQLSGVPPGLVGASVSTSSSPGKPISPHTPHSHTPAIPSRLSAGASIDDSELHRSTLRGGEESGSPSTTTSVSNNAPEPSNLYDRSRATTAIDIPTSPRERYRYERRSSSVAQRHRHAPLPEELDVDYDGLRSASLPLDAGPAGPEMSMSDLYAVPPQVPAAAPLAIRRPSTAAENSAQRGQALRTDGVGASTGSSPARYRSARGSSRLSFSSRSGATTANVVDDDEPLLFALNELEAPIATRRRRNEDEDDEEDSSN